MIYNELVCDITPSSSTALAYHSNITNYYPFSTPPTSLSIPNISSLASKKHH